MKLIEIGHKEDVSADLLQLQHLSAMKMSGLLSGSWGRSRWLHVWRFDLLHVTRPDFQTAPSRNEQLCSEIWRAFSRNSFFLVVLSLLKSGMVVFRADLRHRVPSVTILWREELRKLGNNRPVAVMNPSVAALTGWRILSCTLFPVESFLSRLGVMLTCRLYLSALAEYAQLEAKLLRNASLLRSASHLGTAGGHLLAPNSSY